MGVDKNIDTQKTHEHIDDFLVRKSELLSRYTDDVDVQQDIATTLDSLVASQEFSSTDIQKYFAQALNDLDDISFVTIP